MSGGTLKVFVYGWYRSFFHIEILIATTVLKCTQTKLRKNSFAVPRSGVQLWYSLSGPYNPVHCIGCPVCDGWIEGKKGIKESGCLKWQRFLSAVSNSPDCLPGWKQRIKTSRTGLWHHSIFQSVSLSISTVGCACRLQFLILHDEPSGFCGSVAELTSLKECLKLCCKQKPWILHWPQLQKLGISMICPALLVCSIHSFNSIYTALTVCRVIAVEAGK